MAQKKAKEKKTVKPVEPDSVEAFLDTGGGNRLREVGRGQSGGAHRHS